MRCNTLSKKEGYELFLKDYEKGLFFYKDGYLYSKFKRKNKNTYEELENPVKVSKLNSNGYKRVNNNGKTFYEHRLIFLIHNGLEELMKHECIDHINGDKKDNRIENLRGLSIKDNTLEAEKLVNFKRNYGESNGSHVLKNKEVEEIKEMYKSGFNQYDIARKYGVSQSHISNIINKKKRKMG